MLELINKRLEGHKHNLYNALRFKNWEAARQIDSKIQKLEIKLAKLAREFKI